MIRHLVIVFVMAFVSSCFGTWDTVPTKPYYATHSAYVHWPAPPQPIPPHPRAP